MHLDQLFWNLDVHWIHPGALQDPEAQASVRYFYSLPGWFSVRPRVKKHWINQKVLNKCTVIESSSQKSHLSNVCK